MKNPLRLIAFAFFFLPTLTFSQVIEWQNTIGGDDEDIVSAIQQTADGGYILGGYSESDTSGDKIEGCNGLDDYWIIKTDSSGNIQWQNDIGGNFAEQLYSVEQTADGGYILGGLSNSNIGGDKTENSYGDYDYWIVKTDALGNIQWQNTIGGDSADYLHSIHQTVDGGYILGGNSKSNASGDKTENRMGVGHDYWIVKTDSLGAIQWENTIGGSDPDQLNSIQQTIDGGYILGGYSTSNIGGDKTENSSGIDYWIVKTDATGNTQWQNTIGGSSNDELYSIAQTTDGGYILGGYSNSNIGGDKTEDSNGYWDYWIIKTDSSGVVQWQNTIGGNDIDYLNSIGQTTDGGYILGGRSDSNISGDKTENSNGSADYWIVKTDTSGIIQWQNSIGGSDYDILQSLQQTTDEGYVLCGFSRSSITGDKTENCIGATGEWDYWVVKIIVQPNSINETSTQFDNLVLYPNPANSTLTIETGNLIASDCQLIISDLTGRTLYSKSISTNSTKHYIDISIFSSGIYFVQLLAGERISRDRFVKE